MRMIKCGWENTDDNVRWKNADGKGKELNYNHDGSNLYIGVGGFQRLINWRHSIFNFLGREVMTER